MFGEDFPIEDSRLIEDADMADEPVGAASITIEDSYVPNDLATDEAMPEEEAVDPDVARCRSLPSIPTSQLKSTSNCCQIGVSRTSSKMARARLPS